MSSVIISGDTSGAITLSAPAVAGTNTITLPASTGTVLTTASAVTVAQGGTGSTSLTANNVLLGNGTSAVQVVAPSTSGNVLTSNGTTWASSTPASLGVGQSWTDVSGSRSLGTTYTNSTGKPIAVSWTSTAGYNPAVTVAGVTVVTSVAYLVSAFFIVPNGATYSISSSSSYVWCELR